MTAETDNSKKQIETQFDPIFAELFHFVPSKGNAKRVEIINSAIREASNNGISNLTLESVGKPLGMHKAHVAYYFSSVEEILFIAAQYVTAVAQKLTVELVGQAKSPQERLVAIVRGAFKWARLHPDQAALHLNFFGRSSYDKRSRLLNSQVREAGRRRIESVLCQFTSQNTAKRAKMIQVLITGFIQEALITGSGKISQAEEDIALEAIVVLIPELQSRKTKGSKKK